MQNMNPLMGHEERVFDWQKAAELIKEALKTNSRLYVEAGLEEDYSRTVATIMRDGEVVYGEPYLAST